MEEEKWKFLNNGILTSSINAGLARGNVYRQEVNENNKTEFKNTLKRKLKKYSDSYKTKINDNEHIKNIKQFSDEMSAEFGKILKGNRLRIGTTQKILNLCLKYLWVSGRIPEPPHCPFDFRVIKELGLDIQWTKFYSEQDYRSLIRVADKKAKTKNLSIAKWELEFWNRIYIEF